MRVGTEEAVPRQDRPAGVDLVRPERAEGGRDRRVGILGQLGRHDGLPSGIGPVG